MRTAIYLTPPPAAELLRAAEAWLGRSAFPLTQVPARVAPEAARPEVPARYGFHATLTAPFAPREGTDLVDVARSFARFCAEAPPLSARLGLVALGDFLALGVTDHTPLARLAERAVRHFDDLRAPLTAEDRARRGLDAMDPRGRELTERWGYPYVMERFRFHMTLTGPVAAGDMPAVRAAAEAHFAALLARPHPLVLALFVEDRAGGPFRVAMIEGEEPGTGEADL
jgi:hypothetical protein